MQIPEDFHDIMHSTALAHLATINHDGTPQTTPVWFDFDGRVVVINSAKGRVKDRNMRLHPRVAVSIVDPENPYRYIEIQGAVTSVSEDGADAVIDALAKKYLDVDEYPFRQPGEVRVTYKIDPMRVLTFAPG